MIMYNIDKTIYVNKFINGELKHIPYNIILICDDDSVIAKNEKTQETITMIYYDADRFMERFIPLYTSVEDLRPI